MVYRLFAFDKSIVILNSVFLFLSILRCCFSEMNVVRNVLQKKEVSLKVFIPLDTQM